MKRLIPAFMALMLASMPGPLFAADFGGGVGAADGGKAICVDVDQDGNCEIDGDGTFINWDPDDDGDTDGFLTAFELQINANREAAGATRLVLDTAATRDAMIQFEDLNIVVFEIDWIDADDDFVIKRFDPTATDVWRVDRTSGNITEGNGVEGTWTWDGATGDVELDSAGFIQLDAGKGIQTLSGGLIVFADGVLTLGSVAANQFDILANSTIMARGSVPFAVQPQATFGVQIETSGTKVACSSTHDGTFFYENTLSDSTTGTLFMCMESAADTFSYISIATGG